jgi:uncharacterized membrane protein YesL
LLLLTVLFSVVPGTLEAGGVVFGSEPAYVALVDKFAVGLLVE